MAVTSHDPNERRDQDDRPRGPAVFSRRRLARQQVTFEQIVAWALLIVSFVGSVLLGGGGVEAWVARTPILWLAAAALALQAVLTYAQWIYAAQGWHAWQYVGAVLLSSAMTAGGYWQLAQPWLAGVLIGWQVPAAYAPYAAGGAIIVAALLIDVFPEQTLTA